MTLKFSLAQLLKAQHEQQASDLHITADSPPQLRIHGNLCPLKTEALNSADTKELCYAILNEEQKHKFEDNKELDFSFAIKGVARYRGNMFVQRGAVAAVFRLIPEKVRSFESLGLPLVVEAMCELHRGLVLVTGATGSGKSTTLAAMIDKYNKENAGHIVTIEDPIEFVHSHKMCLINQREVGQDTLSIAKSLKAVLRQDPDVVLIGEMRDLETISAAITIAETGHLVFATLHTNSAVSTISRIVDVFPAHQQPQIRHQLSSNLQGVLCQQLLPCLDGGRILALEIMIPNAAIRAQIREDKIHQINQTMQLGTDKSGMQTLNQSLLALVQRRKINPETALSAAVDPEDLKLSLQRIGINKA